MHFEVRIIQDNRNFFVSFIYGENDAKDRIKLWDNLSNHRVLVNNKPWVILGDFNVIRYVDEHSKGTIDNTHGVKEFRSCIDILDMEDLAMTGIFFYLGSEKKRSRKRYIEEA